MRTQRTAKGNRDDGSSCSRDRGLHRYLRNFGGGGGLNTPNPPFGTPLISYNTSHSVVSHITCSHCTSCVSCHTVLDEGTVITGLLFFSSCLLIISLSVTAEDYRTFRRHQYINIQDISKSLTT